MEFSFQKGAKLIDYQVCIKFFVINDNSENFL